MPENTNEKSAFIAIVGRPNVGKSSLLNAMIGQKVAIVSDKPQTTRTRIMGVLTREEYQLVFIDTPGLLKPHNQLGEYMVKSVSESVAGVDACLLVVEAGKKIAPADLELIKKFKALSLPAVLAINKIDLIPDKSILMAQIAELSQLYDFSAVVPISALDGNGVKDLTTELEKLAEPCGHFFEEDTLTDQPERVMAAEIIREKMLRLLDEEIPHGTAVEIVSFTENEEKGLVKISVNIYCEKESHKGIIIGKQGAMLKKIGTYAREDLEVLLDCKVFLECWVKVKENWRDSNYILKDLGY
jgi:GTP-binding protein Era